MITIIDRYASLCSILSIEILDASKKVDSLNELIVDNKIFELELFQQPAK